MCSPACAALVKEAAVPYESDANLWLRLARDLDKEMRALAVALRDKQLTQIQWQQAMFDALKRGHTESHLIGQQMASRFDPSRGMAALTGQRIAYDEGAYLQGFTNDLIRYIGDDGELNVDRVMNRSRLYIGKMRGTSGEGFIFGSPPGSEFMWTLGGAEEHCLDCPIIASLSPFTEETIYTNPGSGDTPCLGNCKCFWVRHDGAMSAMAA